MISSPSSQPHTHDPLVLTAYLFVVLALLFEHLSNALVDPLGVRTAVWVGRYGMSPSFLANSFFRRWAETSVHNYNPIYT